MASKYILPNNQPFSRLECEVAFKGLSKKEQLYAHHIAQASWKGGLIVLLQTSPESPLIFVLLHRVFRQQSCEELKQVAFDKCNFSEDDWKAFLVYSSSIYSDMGNYRDFGDTKKVPGLAQEKLAALIRASRAYEQDSKTLERLLDGCLARLYVLNDNVAQLGLGDKGITTYFSANCTDEDAEKAKEYMKHKGIEPYNNRLFKTVVDGVTHYEIRLASVMSDGDAAVTSGPEEYQGAQFSVARGDYSGLLAMVVEELKEARKHAANAHEEGMLDEYVRSFQTGALAAHKDGSRHWIKNKGPSVETYIGFIETYRDPTGMRAEWEGFAAMVNGPMSEKFGRLVAAAEKILPRLPWPEAYEKDRFLKPDFTSLDVLAFAGSGVPAGINIPNYDEIRQEEGFKNVSLGNVITAAYTASVLPFLGPEDAELMRQYRTQAFEVQVGLHELFGHGSGKLFAKDKDGKLNFDEKTVKHAETGEPITSFYTPGETYDGVFTDLGSAYEECRAECVGLYLSLDDEVMDIFSVAETLRPTLVYVNWLSLLYNGLARALEMYSTETKKFMQAHSRARYVILRVLLEHGDGVVSIEERQDADGRPDLLLTVCRDKIHTAGKKAIGDFLTRLQVYKATADVAAARAMFDHYSEVPDSGLHPFAKWIPIILEKKQPRRFLVQAHTELKGDDVLLRQYESTPEGLIQSFVDRFPDPAIEDRLLELHQKDAKHFP
ncbi:dipeptidyl peptidase 3-like isoform X1 [Pollicipes pollicipes]|uniref:dipeptidyl peptidase 3-like isoform X1 n=2 Tax=Pollicipes pollicipes TaxID=41117 RepID=UPI001884C411|nr:dipeptidyl peptidase 3-like isoform X1 [Pollicipes pollicipes]XP_037071894.1 dipeptidyl peptidase 3-like isoform X1 [Pollicipes pollicipes]XP_037071895.1 dipeptidyl peptidase 3-like isoform X1 [Pollicipes pollicipes]